ncbi:hypothetical protein C8R46DRAFT_1029879 [Mycena filopes]|nr:hypothetical protein C8R46DRAFT_1029879 [Mycena filopes]
MSNAEILRNEFYKDDEASLEDDEESLSSSIALIGGKLTLDDSEIHDAGRERAENTYRFQLAPLLLSKQIQVVKDLQWYLSEAAALVRDRHRFFKVDPGDTLLPLLQGSSDAQQIRVAWDLLRVRLETGQRFFDKYLAEAEAGRRGNASPASTTSSMLHGFGLMDSTEQKLKHMVTYYPRHKEDLKSSSERLHLLFSSWDTVHQRRSGSLSPDRQEGMEGEEELQIPRDTRNITHRPSRTRVSWPDATAVNSKDFVDDRTVFSPAPPADALDLIPNQHDPSLLKVPSTGVMGTPIEASLSKYQTKYKSSTSFLDQMANQSEVAVHLVPNAAAEPNVLDNLLSGPLGSEGERFKATFGPKKNSDHTFMGAGSSRRTSSPPSGWRNRPNNPFNSPQYANQGGSKPFETPITPIPLKGDFSFFAATGTTPAALGSEAATRLNPMLPPSIATSFAATAPQGNDAAEATEVEAEAEAEAEAAAAADGADGVDGADLQVLLGLPDHQDHQAPQETRGPQELLAEPAPLDRQEEEEALQR